METIQKGAIGINPPSNFKNINVKTELPYQKSADEDENDDYDDDYFIDDDKDFEDNDDEIVESEHKENTTTGKQPIATDEVFVEHQEQNGELVKENTFGTHGFTKPEQKENDQNNNEMFYEYSANDNPNVDI